MLGYKGGVEDKRRGNYNWKGTLNEMDSKAREGIENGGDKEKRRKAARG